MVDWEYPKHGICYVWDDIHCLCKEDDVVLMCSHSTFIIDDKKPRCQVYERFCHEDPSPPGPSPTPPAPGPVPPGPKPHPSPPKPKPSKENDTWDNILQFLLFFGSYLWGAFSLYAMHELYHYYRRRRLNRYHQLLTASSGGAGENVENRRFSGGVYYYNAREDTLEIFIYNLRNEFGGNSVEEHPIVRLSSTDFNVAANRSGQDVTTGQNREREETNPPDNPPTVGNFAQGQGQQDREMEYVDPMKPPPNNQDEEQNKGEPSKLF